jgi:sterol 24-C-methyltransferase
MASTTSMTIPSVGGVEKKDVEGTVESYLNYHNDKNEDHTELRKSRYAEMINHYYDLVTDFYEWGWGQSFHFAPRFQGEAFYASIARAEHYLALKMKMEKGQKILDVGCGVGGPARSIARFAQVHVTGLNNNAYQLKRAAGHTERLGLKGKVAWVKGDFMHLPFEDNSFDGVYQIEATAHAPDKVACYKELLRVLKPGGFFGSYEWCLTDKYEPENPKHRQIKKGIEEGDGLPDIATTAEVVRALNEAGFEVVYEEDRATVENASDYSWYYSLEPRWHPANFQHTPLGRNVLSRALKAFESIGVVPKGTVQVQQFLQTAAISLVDGGVLGVFTPSFFTIAQKPIKK